MKSTARIALALTCTLLSSPVSGEEAATVEARISSAARYLSSDSLGGRGVGSPEIDVAADYIRDQFESMGLRVDAVEGDAFQPFEITQQSKLGDENSAAIAGNSDETKWAVGEDFTPLALGGGGQIDAPLAFVGYGITAPEANYDDYADIDVSGKVVIIMRHEPDQANSQSAFNGTQPSSHAPFRAKVSNAVQHGAAGVIFCTDLFEINRIKRQYNQRRDAAVDKIAEVHAEFAAIESPTEKQRQEYRTRTTRLARRVYEWADRQKELENELLSFDGAGSSNRRVPVLFASRAAIDAVLKQAGQPSLADIETDIDNDLKPRSAALDDLRLVADVSITRDTIPVKNVVAVLDGAGPTADETIVIGAHYDHVGRGGPGSGAADPSKREIHNGADDNASGTAVLLEVARHFASQPEPPARRLVFIAFTGEERGLLGSAHYCENPIVPLDRTVAMLNMDMVGRLDDNKFIVNGTGTAAQFDAWVDSANERAGFDMTKVPGGFGPSDHASFYAKEIPVLHFFTGLHDDYHRPGDDAELLNVVGMRRIADFVIDVATNAVNSPDGVTYLPAEGPSMPNARSGSRPFFGSIPATGEQVDGYAISGVAPDSPAAKAGAQGGDVIVGLDDLKIGGLDDFATGLQKYKAGDKVKITLLRGEERVELEVVLDPPR